MDFPGVALVTGAASGKIERSKLEGRLMKVAGIGKATAVRYAIEGCKRIVIADVNAEGVKETEKEIKDKYAGVKVKAVKAVTVDVRSQNSVQAMVDEAVRTFGRIDYCANVAGILKHGDTSVLSAADFDLMYEVNMRGVFFASKAEINQMLKQEPLLSK
jgi:NAD(P)-dependent dehydrogenase (short-subunit alcohol dehydrogenase family)